MRIARDARTKRKLALRSEEDAKNAKQEDWVNSMTKSTSRYMQEVLIN